MITFLIAPDKFKGSLSTFDVCKAIEEGLLRASPAFRVIRCPMADGGDGLADVIGYYTGATKQIAQVKNPLGKIIRAEWLLSADGETAFIEMAKASGLALLKREDLDPSRTTTYGTGQLVKAAIESGAENIILGIGGSATNDCGIGMAAALGYRFFDKAGKEVAPVGGNLGDIEIIDSSQKQDIRGVRFQVACDVKNVLLGKEGAAYIYAPQKGADADMVKALEAGMTHFASVLKKYLFIDVTAIEGGGAAGGLGAGCVAFLGAQLRSGIDLVMRYANLEQKLQQADYVLTGEGKIDEQTLQGKVVMGVASLAKQYNKKVIAFCGNQAITSAVLAANGVDAVFPVMKYPMSWGEAKQNAYSFLKDTAFSVGSLMK